MIFIQHIVLGRGWEEREDHTPGQSPRALESRVFARLTRAGPATLNGSSRVLYGLPRFGFAASCSTNSNLLVTTTIHGDVWSVDTRPGTSSSRTPHCNPRPRITPHATRRRARSSNVRSSRSVQCAPAASAAPWPNLAAILLPVSLHTTGLCARVRQ